jgi:hypothetical protein
MTIQPVARPPGAAWRDILRRETLEPLYRIATMSFGERGITELIYLVGLYSMVAITLNGFNLPVPERE